MNKSSELSESEIESFFNNSTMKLRWEDEYLYQKKNLLEIKTAKKLEAVNLMKNKIKKSKKKSKKKDYDSRLSDFQQNPKTMMILEFNQSLPCGIKSLAVTHNNVVISRFFDGKMLILTKLYLRLFIYELVKGFFPDKKQKKFMKNIQ